MRISRSLALVKPRSRYYRRAAAALSVCDRVCERSGMSHLAYPNLARLPDFPERGLNYTGLPLEGWASPFLFVPLSISLFIFSSAGLPRPGAGWEIWWTLLNAIFIHPMDFFVGALGVGPKYLLDEFAILDSRYWVERDNTVMWISYMEFFTMAPLSFLWYRSAVRNHWSKHYWALLCSAFQQLGTFFYWGTEWSDDFVHQPALDWPPKFDTYLKIKYFWFVFVFLNGIWVIIPFFVYYRTYKSLSEMVGSDKTKKLH